MSTTSLSGWG